MPFGFVAEGGVAQLCPSCIDRPPGFGQARAALAYDDASKALILPFKHAGRPEVARLLAPMMARSGALLLADATLLVPVPLHRRRLRERGYNQAGQLALALSRSTGLPWLPDALERRKQTEALGGQGLAARTETMRGAISVRARHIARMAGERVILIDDVMTSGATASACADVLLAAGSKRVDVLVAARVPDPMLNAGAPRPRRLLT